MPFTDLVDAAKCVVKALFIREKYMARSLQTFCKTTARSLQELNHKPPGHQRVRGPSRESRRLRCVWAPRHVYRTSHDPALTCVCMCVCVSDASVHPPVSETHPYEGQHMKNLPPDTGYSCKLVDGVIHVYTAQNPMDKWVSGTNRLQTSSELAKYS